MPYVFILGTGKYFEENNGELMYSDEALWASDLEIFESFGSAFGGDASTGASAFMYEGDQISHQFTGVTPNTTYVAYAYGFDYISAPKNENPVYYKGKKQYSCNRVGKI